METSVYRSPSWSLSLLKAFWEILRGTVVGACVFLACMVVCFGLGIYSHHAFGFACLTGAIAGAVVVIVRFVRYLRPAAFGALCGLGTAVIITGIVAVRLSYAETLIDDRATAIAFLTTGFLFNLCAGLITGVALGYLPPIWNRSTKPPLFRQEYLPNEGTEP